MAKTRVPKVYEVVNIHPEYANEDEKKKALAEVAYDLAIIFHKHKVGQKAAAI